MILPPKFNDELLQQHTPQVRSLLSELVQLVYQLLSELAEFRRQIDQLTARVAQLQARIQELQLPPKTPRNPSLLPSYEQPPPPLKTPSGNKRGGQLGHQRNQGQLIAS